MAKKQEGRVKLLVGIVPPADELRFTEAVNSEGAALHFSGIGAGTARSNYLSFFGLNEVEKRFITTLIPESAAGAVLRTLSQKLKMYIPGRGIAFTVPLTGISDLVAGAILSGEREREAVKSGKKEKGIMHEVVVAVVNRKFTDTAIDAARAAGATGGTILHTKSLSNSVAEQNLGTALVTETDTLLFLTTSEYKVGIMKAIRDVAGLKTEGAAVLFSMPVDAIVGIGRPTDEDDASEEK